MTRTLTTLLLGLCAAPASADYVLSLEAKGQRDYYCQITVALENRTAETLTEISGFFHSYSDGREVGRSKGAWFMNVPPGARSEATFETPRAPCDEVDRYDFTVGACRLGAGFEDQSSCAARMSGEGPIRISGP